MMHNAMHFHPGSMQNWQYDEGCILHIMLQQW